jgi:hypothetical protein
MAMVIAGIGSLLLAIILIMMKYELRKNGYPASWLSSWLDDMKNMSRLIKAEINPQRRKKYRIIYFSVTLSFLPFFLAILIAVVTIFVKSPRP